MFLELWMLCVLALTFGACAWFSTRSGFKIGTLTTLMVLENDRIIRVHDDGSISPYSAIPKAKKKSKSTKLA